MTAADRSVGRTPFAVIVAASLIGITTGGLMIALEHLIDEVLHVLAESPVWVPAAAVLGGMLATALVIRLGAGGDTASTEVYVEQFHRATPDLNVAHAPGRLGGAFTTLAGGAPLGMEGPAVYMGSVVATVVHRYWRRLDRASVHALLVAGAAAGIAAVFKAPAAGAIFAMEVPFRGRLAGERVLPALFGAGAGYLTMAAVEGVEPDLEVPLIEMTFGRSMWSLVLGLAIGVAAIGVIWLVATAERLSERAGPVARAGLAGLALAGLYAISRGLTGESLALTSGNAVIDWAIQPDHAIWLLLAVFAIRALGPAITIAGGGVGGLFIPLMAAGAVIGRIFADAVDPQETALYVTVGAACMLGGGYAAPLTGVVFVAEYTGQASVIVPALVAVTMTRLVVRDRSVSPNQVN